jgi:hypothetical protein
MCFWTPTTTIKNPTPARSAVSPSTGSSSALNAHSPCARRRRSTRKRTMPPSFVTGSRLLARVCWAIDIMEASLVRLWTTVSRSRRISRRAPLAPGRCPSPPRPRMIPTSCSDCRELRRVSAVSTHASGGAFGGTSTPPLSYLLLRTVSPFELLDASLALDSVPRHGRGHVVLVSPLSICLAPQADVGLISSSPLINVKTSEIGRHRSDSRRPWLPS